jgi:hypothetical protein
MSTTVLTLAALLIGIFVILSLNYNHRHYHDNHDHTQRCIGRYREEVKVNRVPVDPYTIHT